MSKKDVKNVRKNTTQIVLSNSTTFWFTQKGNPLQELAYIFNSLFLRVFWFFYIHQYLRIVTVILPFDMALISFPHINVFRWMSISTLMETLLRTLNTFILLFNKIQGNRIVTILPLGSNRKYMASFMLITSHEHLGLICILWIMR